MPYGLVFNDTLIKAHIPTIIDSWKVRERWLKNNNPPEIENHPEGVAIGSREHSNYIFCAGQLSRFGKTADEVIGWAKFFAEEMPQLIDPRLFTRNISTLEKEMLNKAFPFGNDQDDRIKGWFDNLEIIREEFNGDPRELVLGIYPADSSVDAIMEARSYQIKRLSRFYGIQHKIAQLLIPWFQVVKWEEYPDAPGSPAEWSSTRKIPAVPVDHWFMKMVKQFGWIVSYVSQRRELVSGPISDHICKILVQEGYTWQERHDFAQAMWHIGARRCAAGRKKRNEYKQRAHCLGCPAFNFCLGIVPADSENENTGRSNWHLFKPHSIKTLYDQ